MSKSRRRKEKDLEITVDDLVTFGKKLWSIKRKIQLRRQRRMRFPTDAEEIHRRAELIRQKLKEERDQARAKAREHDLLMEDLRIIRNHQRWHSAEDKKISLTQRLRKRIKKEAVA